MASGPLVSIVIPTLNEDLAIPIAHLSEYVGRLGHRFELLFIDDSREEVRERARSVALAANVPPNVTIRLIDGPGLGKGAAVGRGISESRGDVVFLMDGDLPVPLATIEDFLGRIERGADVVVAERARHRSFATPFRWVLSRGLLVLQQTLIFHSRRFHDTQCGFKAFRGDFIRELAKIQIIDGGMYDLEYLYVAVRRGATIETVEVAQNAERRESRINGWKCLRQDPVDLMRIKVHGTLRGYDRDGRAI